MRSYPSRLGTGVGGLSLDSKGRQQGEGEVAEGVGEGGEGGVISHTLGRVVGGVNWCLVVRQGRPQERRESECGGKALEGLVVGEVDWRQRSARRRGGQGRPARKGQWVY